jgi:hypothetical protein
MVKREVKLPIAAELRGITIKIKIGSVRGEF